ncbi:MAG: N-acetyl-gamma-glutamyl-phosphate reductase, partial [Clostridiales bacterium]|nr:N-acetyl-gamma-glutamyl-phosphate reductase [Clostridiales bacterium]
AGAQTLALLLGHRDVQIAHMMSVSNIGQAADQVFPSLSGLLPGRIEAVDTDALIEGCDVVFMAMPHGQAVAPAALLAAAGKKVIDLGADFRFRESGVYEQWYKTPHAEPLLTRRAVYGLPELYRDAIRGAQVVGNPGCYPTASILALYPLLKRGLAVKGSIVIDAKSGVSGAGRTPTAGNIFAEVNESVRAYGVASHRHTPEIEQALAEIGGAEQAVSFTPHLIPMTRGILATVYASLREPLSGEALCALYRETYQDEYFVKVHDHGVWPETKWTLGGNFCHIGLTYDARTGRAVVCAAIDNLVKGAAGQAIQNMNLMFGLPENAGLANPPLTP